MADGQGTDTLTQVGLMDLLWGNRMEGGIRQPCQILVSDFVNQILGSGALHDAIETLQAATGDPEAIAKSI